MDRRRFAQVLATTALAAAAPGLAAVESMSPEAGRDETPFPLSVMLWTVFTDLPFEQRLAKVAEAGYKNVQLVGEYSKWSDAEYEGANAARKRLGIQFDATAGLKHGVGDPAVRDAFLAELDQAMTPMKTLAANHSSDGPASCSQESSRQWGSAAPRFTLPMS